MDRNGQMRKKNSTTICSPFTNGCCQINVFLVNHCQCGSMRKTSPRVWNQDVDRVWLTSVKIKVLKKSQGNAAFSLSRPVFFNSSPRWPAEPAQHNQPFQNATLKPSLWFPLTLKRSSPPHFSVHRLSCAWEALFIQDVASRCRMLNIAQRKVTVQTLESLSRWTHFARLRTFVPVRLSIIWPGMTKVYVFLLGDFSPSLCDCLSWHPEPGRVSWPLEALGLIVS